MCVRHSLHLSLPYLSLTSGHARCKVTRRAVRLLSHSDTKGGLLRFTTVSCVPSEGLQRKEKRKET